MRTNNPTLWTPTIESIATTFSTPVNHFPKRILLARRYELGGTSFIWEHKLIQFYTSTCAFIPRPSVDCSVIGIHRIPHCAF